MLELVLKQDPTLIKETHSWVVFYQPSTSGKDAVYFLSSLVIARLLQIIPTGSSSATYRQPKKTGRLLLLKQL